MYTLEYTRDLARGEHLWEKGCRPGRLCGDWKTGKGLGRGLSLVVKQVGKETMGGQRPPWGSNFWKILVVGPQDRCGW